MRLRGGLGPNQNHGIAPRHGRADFFGEIIAATHAGMIHPHLGPAAFSSASKRRTKSLLSQQWLMKIFGDSMGICLVSNSEKILDKKVFLFYIESAGANPSIVADVGSA